MVNKNNNKKFKKRPNKRPNKSPNMKKKQIIKKKKKNNTVNAYKQDSTNSILLKQIDKININGEEENMANKKPSKKTNKKTTKKAQPKKVNKKQIKKESKKEKKSKKKKGILSKIWLAIKIFIVLALIGIVTIAGIAVGMLYGVFGDDLEITEEELTIAGNSVILDSKGKVLAELSGDENRKVITLDDMAEYLPKAYVAIEDERFYNHDGVDFKRTGGAILTFVTHGGSTSYGGSTITQQLVKNITEDNAKTGKEGITRKVKEWARAYKLERMLSKDQILELYLNVIFVGDKYYGVETGSEYYFAKSAKDLSLVECAFLAGINNSPNAYNPYSTKTGEYGKNDEKTNRINKRTKTVLTKMKDLGYITQEQYNEAYKQVDEGIKFKKKDLIGSIYSYHTDAVISQVITDIAKEKGWTREFTSTYIYGGGLKIYSTQDGEVQEKLEAVMENTKAYQKTSKSTGAKSQAAMTIIDNKTGYVVAVVGGLGEKKNSRGLNRATQSPRQTGSSIKPIADLVPAINEGVATAATLYNDSYTMFEGNFDPKNQGRYEGIMNLRVATGKSKNIPFVKIMAEIRPEKSREYLRNMGVTTLDDKGDAGLSMAIGGLYKGISTLEMAAAYATIENDGVYRTPLLYTKIVDADGNTFFEPTQEKKTVFTAQTAYVVKDMLKSVVTAGYGTAPYCKISGIDVAAKTGTTNEDKDRWLCGFTDYYTGATWYGYDDPEEVKFNGNPAGQIWAATMKSVHKGKEKSTFKKPDGIVSAKICKHTGLKAKNSCKDTYSEIFVKGTVPEECDEGSSAAKICTSSNLLANEYCPNTKTEYFAYTIVKERTKLWKTSGTGYKKAPVQVCREHSKESYISSHDTAPTIKLNGSSKVELKVGESYKEERATATDEIDGDLTNKIKISGSVNTSKAGTYTVKYTVSNGRGKTITVTRTIVVKDTTPSKPNKPTEGNNSTETGSSSGENNTSQENNTTESGNKTELDKDKDKNKEKEN